MTPEIQAEWLRRQGHVIQQTTSSFWVQVGSLIYQAFPYHWVIEPDETELQQFLQKNKALGLRYSTPIEAPAGAASYHVVYGQAEYLLSNLPKKARYDVRRGLKKVTIEPISFARLADEGWPLRAETLVRQNRVGAENQGWWQRLCRSTRGLPGFEAWAASANGQLVASIIAFTCDDCCTILYQQSATDYLKYGVNNALCYVFTHEMVSRPTISSLFYSLHSLDAPASVDKFKFRMGYRAKPVRQRVVFHPWLEPIFNRVSHAGLQQLQRWRPGNPTLAKAEGLLRFYLAGRRPLHKQHWPACLAGIKLRGKG